MARTHFRARFQGESGNTLDEKSVRRGSVPLGTVTSGTGFAVNELPIKAENGALR